MRKGSLVAAPISSECHPSSCPSFPQGPVDGGKFQKGGGVLCTWVKQGRFGSFFVLCFVALGGHCFQMLCLPGFGTHANTQNLPHFRAFPASIQEHPPRKCLFFMANAKLPNRPGFALLQGFSQAPPSYGSERYGFGVFHRPLNGPF